MRYLTIVFAYEDKLPALAKQCMNAFGENIEGVCAASRYDEMSRVEYLEGLLEENCISYDEPELEQTND